jgi:hypothetical protein
MRAGRLALGSALCLGHVPASCIRAGKGRGLGRLGCQAARRQVIKPDDCPRKSVCHVSAQTLANRP